MNRSLAVLLAALAVVGCGPSNPTAPEPTPADFTLSADEVEQQFRTDPTGAEAKYSGKTLQVKGRIGFKKGSDTEESFVDMLADVGQPITCNFGQGKKSVVDALVTGTWFTVRGRYSGMKDKKPVLSDCVVVPNKK